MIIDLTFNVAAPPDQVWEELRHVSRHVDWMADAESIEFRTTQREGVGVEFDCRTKVGPFRLTDRMTITNWVDGVSMGVRHVGLVTGEGQFTLTPTASGTAVRWREELRFPMFLGGELGTLFARPILRTIWRGNLRRLAAIVTR